MQLSFLGIEGDYQVLVTVHSLVLLESKCAECYDEPGTIRRNSCCDGDYDESSCPDSCDILLRFCQLIELPQFNFTNTFLSTQCGQSTMFNHVTDMFGFNFKAGEIHRFDEVGLLGGSFMTLRNPVTYNETGKWVSLVIIVLIIVETQQPSTERSSIKYISC